MPERQIAKEVLIEFVALDCTYIGLAKCEIRTRTLTGLKHGDSDGTNGSDV